MHSPYFGISWDSNSTSFFLLLFASKAKPYQYFPPGFLESTKYWKAIEPLTSNPPGIFFARSSRLPSGGSEVLACNPDGAYFFLIVGSILFSYFLICVTNSFMDNDVIRLFYVAG